jgi:integral membrane protein (TIGR01906 family)
VSGATAQGRRVGWRRLVGGLAGGLCVVAIPLALVGYNLRGVALDERFYMAEFARYEIGPRNGFTNDQLRTVANAFIAYFQAPPGRMNLQVARDGVMQPLFNERELAHMEDVQVLIQGILQLGTLAAVYVVVFGAVGALVGRRAFLPLASGVLLASAALTVALFAVLGALALTDFSELFLQFHLMSFSNDLWLLDPRDYLLRLFPQEFFQDAALRIAGATLLQALALGVLGLAGWLASRRAGARGR